MSRTRLKLLFIIIALLISSALSYINSDFLFINPFNTYFEFENASRIAADSTGNRYIVYDSSEKAARINSSGRIEYILYGNSDSPDRFSKAWDITCDDRGNLYLLEFISDDSGLKIDSENIKIFSSDGKYIRTLYTRKYADDKPDMEGNYRKIRFINDKIFYHYTDGASFYIGSISCITGENDIIRHIKIPDPKLNIVDCDFLPDLTAIAYITKKGQVFLSENGEEFRQLYTSSDPVEKNTISIPWQVSIDPDFIYFSDAGLRKIVRVNIRSSADKKTGHRDTQKNIYEISGDAQGIIRSFQVTGSGFIAVTDNTVMQGDFSGKSYIESEGKKYSTLIIIKRWLVFSCGILAVLSMLALLAWFYIYVLKRTISEVVMQSAMIIIAVLIASTIVLQISVSTFTSIYKENVFSNLKYISQLSHKYIDGDLAGKIRNREDFMNEDYVKLRAQVHSVYNDNNDEWNSDYYAGLYTLKDDKIYVLMFCDDSSGVNFPYKENYRETPFAGVIDRGETATVEESDVYGSWIYALSPVYDSQGKISAVLEVGKDLNKFREQIKSFITGITKEIITVLIILVLIMLEITILRDVLHKRDKPGYGEGIGEFGKYSVHTVRMLAFIIAFSYALPVSYTPLMMKDLLSAAGTTLFGLSEGVAMAVPISAEMLGTALFAVIAGYLVDKRGWKQPFLYGTVLMSAGAFIAYSLSSPYMFILARFLVGAAYGFALVTLQCYPMISPDIKTRNSGLASQNSGLNAGYCCGVAIGGLCADYIGYSTVYIFSVFAAAVAIPYAGYLMSNSRTSDAGAEKAVSAGDVLRFFSSRNVFVFFTAAFIPVSICSMFLAYMFPVFAESKGVSAGDIGRVFMLNSLVIIYLGPAIVRFLTSRKFFRGKNAMALYMIITLTGLVFFGIKPGILTAIIIIVFVGMGDSFGLPMSNDYLIGLRAAAKIGYDRSVGYLNFIGNIGQMIGPVIMGYLFLMGYQKGTYIILMCMTAAMFVFLIFSRDEVKADEY